MPTAFIFFTNFIFSPRLARFIMRGQKGFWRRPASRTYAYNLNVGEHYYSPMTSYLDAERGSREKRVHKQRAELREGEAHTQSTIWTFYGWRLWLTTNGPALMSLFPSGKHVKISILSPEGKSNPRNKITRFFLKSVCLTRLCIWPFNRQVESVKNPIQKYEILCSVIVIIVLCRAKWIHAKESFCLRLYLT